MKPWIFSLLLPVIAARADSSRPALAVLPSEPRLAPASVALPSLPAVPMMKAAELAASAEAVSLPRAGIPSLPTVRSADPTAPSPQVRRDGPNPAITISPNADGVLDVTGIVPAESADPAPNPFRPRYHPRWQMRELPLAVGSVLVANDPADASALINGRLYVPGDNFEGMAVAAISAEAIELRRGKILLRIPVQDQPTVLRLPP